MHSVVIHQYAERLTAIEFGAADIKPTNFLVFIGGLLDGFMTVPYVAPMAEAITKKYEEKWVVVQALISSSYVGFGTGSLERDTKELAKLIKHLRTERGTPDSKVILMGHSTGSQDTMEYLTKRILDPDFDPLLRIDAGIIQAPASDSEGIAFAFGDDDLTPLIRKSQKMIEDGQADELLPVAAMKYTFGSPVTAYRFNSLLGKRGDDDYFSSYLEEPEVRQTFGKVLKPLLVLISGGDEYIPPHVDLSKLISRWEAVCDPNVWSKYSQVMPGASHNVGPKSKPGALNILIESVLSFIDAEF